MILSGGLLNNDFVWRICLDVSRIVNEHLYLSKIDSYINLIPPNDNNYLVEAKKLGFKSICYNLEVFGKEDFVQICPGKQKVYGYDNFIESFCYTSKLMGKGKVRNNFVLGLQDIKKVREGVKFLSDLGVVSDYSVFYPRPGSVMSKHKLTDPDMVLDFTRFLAKNYQRYQFKPFCCPLSSRSSLINDILAIEA
jgi:hypothetical protein